MALCFIVKIQRGELGSGLQEQPSQQTPISLTQVTLELQPKDVGIITASQWDNGNQHTKVELITMKVMTQTDRLSQSKLQAFHLSQDSKKGPCNSHCIQT